MSSQVLRRMEREMCFICGMTISRGNRSEVSQMKMDKLVSVQRTVENSSTILCDTLSRILNETVMGEESVCRLCTNLLNDIDYHLKEAQEKTDEITAKYLDKEKEQQRLQLEEQQRRTSSRKHRDRHKDDIRPRSPSHVPVRGGGKGQSFFKSPEKIKEERSKSPRKKHSSPSKGVDDSDDEVSEKKRKLLSRVLAPAKKNRHPSSGLDEDERKLTIDEEVELLRKIRKKEKKLKKREKKRRMMEEKMKEPEDDIDLDHNDYIQDISDEDEPAAPQYSSPSKSKASEDIRTVDLTQLGDLFPEYQPANSSGDNNSHVFAKKSIPTTSQQQQQQQQQSVYILPESSYTIQPGQDIPIIDCRNLVTSRVDASDIVINEHGADHVLVTPAPLVTSDVTSVTTPAKTAKSQESEGGRKGGTPSGTPSVPCPHCPKKFMRGYNMRVHIERVHNKSKPWQCQFCEKTFATTSDLKQHLSSHGMGKIHKCEDCGREFTNRDSAILHRKQHNNERTHFCKDCGKGFFKASCLARHMRSHTGEKPFNCEFCNKGFSQVTTLKNHKKVCKAAVTAIEGAEFTIEETKAK